MIITYIIIAVTCLVSYQALNNMTLFERWKWNPYAAKNNKEAYRAFTHLFLHSGFPHLFFNMYGLYMFGGQVEKIFTHEMAFRSAFPYYQYWGESLGQVYYLMLYFLGGLIATLPSIQKHSNNYGYSAVGASGAVSAVLVAYMIMFPNAELLFFFILPLKGWMAIILFFVFEHFMNKRGGTNIAHDAHIWGALFGILFVFVLNVDFLTRFIHEVRSFFF